MNDCPFCTVDRTASAGRLHRAWRGVRWLFPPVAMVLIPKCPMCAVADVALLTGMGISMSAGRWIRLSMWAVCAAAMAYLVLRWWSNRTGAVAVKR